MEACLSDGSACRMFWPKEVWGRYGDSLEAFKAQGNAEAAVGCLNELVTDALRWGRHHGIASSATGSATGPVLHRAKSSPSPVPMLSHIQ